MNFSSGASVEEILLKKGTTKAEIPIDTEYLGVGIRDKQIILFCVSKFENAPRRETEFLVISSKVPLPKDNYRYFWYVGTMPKAGLHVFEVH